MVDFLQGIMPRDDDGWYEFHLHHHVHLDARLRENHLRSMVHSQGRQNNRKLRLVVDNDDNYIGSGDTRDLRNYSLPGIDVFVKYGAVPEVMHLDEIVVRRGSVTEYVAYSKDARNTGTTRHIEGLYPTGRVHTSEPAMQNIPIHTPEGDAIKAAFTTGRTASRAPNLSNAPKRGRKLFDFGLEEDLK